MQHVAHEAAREDDRMRIAVIVPTYRRPRDLERCLAALRAQRRPADRVVIVARADDAATHAVLHDAQGLPLQVVPVSTGGVVAALNEGLERVAADLADRDVVAFTDDDAAPRADWLERVAAHFAADERLGGLGGRDWVHHHGRLEDGARNVVGKVSWFGRCIGDHHLGVGAPREVDVLKGVNMSFRAAALAGVRFDTRLRGTGAQVANELGVSLEVKRRGWKLVYDPAVAVDHYPSARHDEDQRDAFCAEAVRNAVFNETLLLCKHFDPLRRIAFIAWALAVGHRAAPGIVQWLRLLPRQLDTATARFAATLAGRMAGWMAPR
jgi:cellulose synthase/poly-beta-1,6-N-acetylglucosamine synthase-like glycosyltransferase